MGIKIISHNKRANYDFFLIEKVEAGIELLGTEVKSLRLGKALINEAFVTIDQKLEVWVHNINIPHYSHGNINNHEETRKRKLLLKKIEIISLLKKMKTQSLTIIPIMIYFKGSIAKLEIALAKGKKLHDKRESEAKKDAERKIKSGDYE